MVIPTISGPTISDPTETVKLHGSHGDIVLFHDGHINIQSRNRLLSPFDDNLGAQTVQNYRAWVKGFSHFFKVFVSFLCISMLRSTQFMRFSYQRFHHLLPEHYHAIDTRCDSL